MQTQQGLHIAFLPERGGKLFWRVQDGRQVIDTVITLDEVDALVEELQKHKKYALAANERHAHLLSIAYDHGKSAKERGISKWVFYDKIFQSIHKLGAMPPDINAEWERGWEDGIVKEQPFLPSFAEGANPFEPAQWTGTSDPEILAQFTCYKTQWHGGTVWLRVYNDDRSPHAAKYQFTSDYGRNSDNSFSGSLNREQDNLPFEDACDMVLLQVDKWCRRYRARVPVLG